MPTSSHLLRIDVVIALHDLVISEFGGKAGMISSAQLESALQQPFAGLADGTQFYPTIFEKAAVLIQGIVLNHAFVDGNKRTAAFLTGFYLLDNGSALKFSQSEIVEFVVAIAEKKLSRDEIISWLKEHSKPA